MIITQIMSEDGLSTLYIPSKLTTKVANLSIVSFDELLFNS